MTEALSNVLQMTAAAASVILMGVCGVCLCARLTCVMRGQENASGLTKEPFQIPLPFREMALAAAAAVLSRLALYALAYGFYRAGGGTQSFAGSFEALWTHWDVRHYLGIAKDGYTSVGDERLRLVFFPLYPAVTRVFSVFTGGRLFMAGTLVSLLASGVCAALLYDLANMHLGRRGARLAVAYFLLNPMSVFLACAYTEALFIALTLAAVCLLVCLLAFPSIPARLLPQPQAKAASGHSIWQILKKNKVFTLMLIACFFGMMGVMPISNFLVSLVNSHGGGSTALGVAQFLMAASELPSALVFGLLQKKMSSAKILLISIIFMVVKPLLILASGSLGMLLAVQPVQMLGYGLFFPASVYFANESVSPADRVQGQSIRTILAISLSTLLGSLVSGYLIDLGGTTLMLWFSTGCASIGVLIALGALAVQKKSVRV